MKPIKTFRIGSEVFFKGIKGFKPKDIDELCIMDEFPMRGYVLHAQGLHGKDVFFFKNMNKEGFKQTVKESKLPMTVGKFLVPDFCKHLGFTIDDLKEFEDMFEKIDEKHKYEKIIYDSYIKNNGFFLTDDQRQEAYESYKNTR